MQQREIEAIAHVRSVVKKTAKELGISEDKMIELVRKSDVSPEAMDLKTYLDSSEVQASMQPSMKKMSKWVGTLPLKEADSLSAHMKEIR
ncbi:hypothetical protein QWJ34_11005 [Saccharibacillus sp. CPCC 101409]|uniref:hypothetical protein n=1 Tax=Saccharibacillus sp. CPCC 101409 TaxID=3058041 RepID=UPI002673F253|nr:hypothetical protein [Saccharibacillus sp. CPCC 101409]MDO3410290.1 hypothetical protein [Saccharibacillus sp. CPCC 101409]